MKLIDALRIAGKRIHIDFDESKLINHSGEKGQYREFILSSLLRPYLPECYGLGTGEVFSSAGEISKQIDIVIYDNVYSNVLLKNKSSSLFPCESIYGQIEVKSMLNSAELQASVENIISVKKLNRTESSGLDITPFQALNFQGFNITSVKSNPYLGVIFAYDSIEPTTLITYLNSLIAKENKFHLPDFIFCLKKGYFIFRANNYENAPLDVEYNNFGILKTSEDLIPLMFLTINAYLNNIRLKAINYSDYWIKLFTDIATNQPK